MAWPRGGSCDPCADTAGVPRLRILSAERSVPCTTRGPPSIYFFDTPSLKRLRGTPAAALFLLFPILHPQVVCDALDGPLVIRILMQPARIGHVCAYASTSDCQQIVTRKLTEVTYGYSHQSPVFLAFSNH